MATKKKVVTRKKLAAVAVRKSRVISVERFLENLTLLYPFDHTAPGMVTAFIKNAKPELPYYASVVRYETINATGDRREYGKKQVLTAAYGVTLQAAIEQVVRMWPDMMSTPLRLKKTNYRTQWRGGKK